MIVPAPPVVAAVPGPGVELVRTPRVRPHSFASTIPITTPIAVQTSITQISEACASATTNDTSTRLLFATTNATR